MYALADSHVQTTAFMHFEAAWIDLLLMLCWWPQLRGHGSHSELAEVEASCRYLKVLLADHNLINMKVTAHTHPLCMRKKALRWEKVVRKEKKKPTFRLQRQGGPCW